MQYRIEYKAPYAGTSWSKSEIPKGLIEANSPEEAINKADSLYGLTKTFSYRAIPIAPDFEEFVWQSPIFGKWVPKT